MHKKRLTYLFFVYMFLFSVVVTHWFLVIMFLSLISTLHFITLLSLFLLIRLPKKMLMFIKATLSQITTDNHLKRVFIYVLKDQ